MRVMLVQLEWCQWKSSIDILDIFINVKQTEFAADWMWGMKGRKES